jgi:hypothetical protein
MKKLLALALLSVLSLPIYSQGNLQFNRVIQEAFTPSILTNTLTTIGNITVPSGKVWKIESSVISSTTLTSNNYVFMARLFIAGHCTWSQSAPNGSLVIDRQNSPLWLKSGSYEIQVYHSNASLGTLVPFPFNVSYSGIEFNITP